MKNTIKLIALSAFLPFQVYSQHLQNDTTGNYRLVWSDEFNKKGMPDTTSWKFERGFVRNHELQWYQPENASCRKGLLTISVEKEHRPNPNYVAGSNNWKTNREFIDYTSTSMHTRGLHQWLYGRFVMRARIDTDSGLWPAFWTLGINHPWPLNGEIDIMEYYRKKLLANIACGNGPNKARWFSRSRPLDSLGKDWSKQFHVWRMDWDKEAISLYVDDMLMNRVELTKLINGDGSGLNPFNEPQYVLLDLALGGDNGGPLGDTAFSRKFEIDYVRVYQRPDQTGN